MLFFISGLSKTTFFEEILFRNFVNIFKYKYYYFKYTKNSRHVYYFFNKLTNTSLGKLTFQNCLIFFLPCFCFSSNFFFLVISQPYSFAVTSFLIADISSLHTISHQTTA
ncbi:hypothetical protein GW891_02265 [bacterium]|nr:hypothetical protein [bacterium]